MKKGQDRKPVCLIVDEMDGALGGGSDINKGIGQVADYIQKAIKALSDQKKK